MAIRRLNQVFVMVLVALVASASSAEAVMLSEIIDNTRTSFAGLPNLFSAAAYLLGAFFSIHGIFKFKDHVDNPVQNHVSAGVKRFLAGGMMFALPYTANTLNGTLMNGTHAGINATGVHSAPTGNGMDHMIVSFVQNVYSPMSNLLLAFTYIAAIILLIVGITRLTKTAQEGPRGPAGLGTVMTFLASGALFSFADMMGGFLSSLFGDAVVSRNAVIATTVISDPNDSAKISAVLESLMAFITLVGFIAFIRGWFVLKAFADGGDGKSSLSQALTLLFGGALAINMGELVNVLQSTVGISGITFS